MRQRTDMARFDDTSDVSAKQPAPGGGSAHTRKCMGCNLSKSQQGSRGLGLRWRCAACVAIKRKTA